MKSLLLVLISLLLGINKNFSQITITKSDVSCHDCTDGSASVSVTGGTPPYKYNWSTGGTGTSISGLAPGSYSVVITDDNGCTGFESVIINNKPKPPDPFVIPVVASSDPNDITGPAGYGDPKWVSVNDVLPYLIRFENDPKTATSAVNKVTITLPIDNMANMFSFQLGDFSFRGFNFQVPPYTSHYFKRLDLVDTIGVFMDVTAGIDVTKKQAFWIFQAFDPITGLPNIDPDLGFLLINDSITHFGEGSVNFSIKPKSSSKTGDTIKAYASIVFDINAPLLTNTAFNTIDAKPPVSKIKSITPITSDNIEITWSGNDDTKGSGIKAYKLLISSKNEPYLPYADITDTSYIFKLPGGNEYKIQSVANDHTNNMERVKPDPDTIFYLIPKVRLGNNMSICINDSAVLNAGSGFNSYLWNDGSTNPTLTVKAAGKYYVTAIKDTITSSDTIVIAMAQLPVPSLHNNLSEFCEGDSLSLNAGAGYKNYTWSTQENLQTIKIKTPGNYLVTVTDKNGCQGLDSISVTMFNKPLFSLGRDTTIGNKDSIVLVPRPTGFTSYLWYNNTINDSLMLVGKKIEAGLHVYWVKVTDSKNCSNTDTIRITIIDNNGIEYGKLDNLLVYFFPNPTMGMLNLRIEGVVFGDLKLELFNIEGTLLMVKQYQNSKTIVTDQLDMSNMALGAYIIRVTYKDIEMLRTIIKQ